MGTVRLHLQEQMQSVMLTCFHSVQGKLQRRLGYSDLLGFDFLVDEHFQVLTSGCVLQCNACSVHCAESCVGTCHADPGPAGVVD